MWTTNVTTAVVFDEKCSIRNEVNVKSNSQLAELQLEPRYKWCFHVNPIDSNQPQINASGKKKRKA